MVQFDVTYQLCSDDFLWKEKKDWWVIQLPEHLSERLLSATKSAASGFQATAETSGCEKSENDFGAVPTGPNASLSESDNGTLWLKGGTDCYIRKDGRQNEEEKREVCIEKAQPTDVKLVCCTESDTYRLVWEKFDQIQYFALKVPPENTNKALDGAPDAVIPKDASNPINSNKNNSGNSNEDNSGNSNEDNSGNSNEDNSGNSNEDNSGNSNKDVAMREVSSCDGSETQNQEEGIGAKMLRSDTDCCPVMCLVGEIQQILCLRPTIPDYSQIDTLFVKTEERAKARKETFLHRGAENAESSFNYCDSDGNVENTPTNIVLPDHTPFMGLTKRDILNFVQASEEEIFGYLLEAFVICDVDSPNVICDVDSPNQNRKSLFAAEQQNHADAAITASGDPVWYRITIDELFAATRLLLCQLSIDMISPLNFSLREATDCMDTAAKREDFTLSSGVSLSGPIMLQLLRYIADVPPMGPAADRVGLDFRELKNSEKYRLMMEQLTYVSTMEKSRNIAANSDEIKLSLDPLRILRVVQLAVLSQHRSLPYDVFKTLTSELLSEILPAEVTSPSELIVDFEDLPSRFNVNRRAGLSGLGGEEFGRDASGAFDPNFGFSGIHFLTERAARKKQSGINVNDSKELAILVGGYGYFTMDTQTQLACKFQLHWLPHYMLPWKWEDRARELLKKKPVWFEDELKIYLAPTLHAESQPVSAILASNFQRISREPPHRYVTRRINIHD